METKTARLTLLIDPQKKVAFERLCAQQDRTASQVVRQLIRDYLALHGVVLQPAGQARPAAADGRSPAARKAAAAKRTAPAQASPAGQPVPRRRG